MRKTLILFLTVFITSCNSQINNVNTVKKTDNDIKNLTSVQNSSEIIVSSANLPQKYSSVSLNNNGDYVVSWLKLLKDEYKVEIYVKNFKADGSSLKEIKVNSSEIKISENALFLGEPFQGESNIPKVAIDDKGNFYVLWFMNGGLYFRTFDSNGIAKNTETKLDTLTSEIRDYSIKAKNDIVLVSWKSDSGDIKVKKLKDTILTDVSNKLTTKNFTALSINDNNEFIVSSDNILQFFDKNGVSSEPFVIKQEGGDVLGCLLNNDGNIFVFYRVITTTLNAFAFQSYDKTGKVLNKPVLVKQFSNDNLLKRYLASSINKKGDFIVSWGGINIYDKGKEDIYATVYPKDSLDKKEFKLSNVDDSFKANPNISLNDKGEFVSTWDKWNDNKDEFSIIAKKASISNPPIIKIEDITPNPALCTEPKIQPLVDLPKNLPEMTTEFGKKTLQQYKDRIEKIKNKPIYTGPIEIKLMINNQDVDYTKKENLATYKKIPNPKNPASVSMVTINGTTFAIDDMGLISYFSKSACKDKLIELYNVKTLNTISGFDYISLDMSKAPIDKLETLIRERNKLLQEDITSIKFDSVESLQLVTLYFELEYKYYYMFKSLELNIANGLVG